ncbi:MAG: aldolase/citrate lyase family protein [Clostridia bacterium]|jgi:2-keto-3-deoxy-L-rhamnonate aldolase RhmA|nr:aldolase/citrate lyase family protein [Clostridia bacterium]
MNKVIEKFKNGEKTIGTLCHIRNAASVEAYGYTGLDFVMFDIEHSPADIGEITDYFTTCKAAGITSFVRVNEAARTPILKCLDAGAQVIVVPGIDSTEQVKKVIEWGKFYPLGNRGYCMTRDGGWGYDSKHKYGLKGYMKTSNAETLIIPQCETIGCVEHIEEIAAMDGVGGILIVPYDLSMNMGIPGEFGNPNFIKSVARVLKACQDNKKIAINFASTHDEAKNMLLRGFDGVLYGLDIAVLIDTYKSMVTRLKSDIKET